MSALCRQLPQGYVWVGGLYRMARRLAAIRLSEPYRPCSQAQLLPVVAGLVDPALSCTTNQTLNTPWPLTVPLESFT